MSEPGELPSGYIEVKHTDSQIRIDKKTFPWIKQEQDSPLSIVTLDDGRKFYLTSIVSCHKTLTDEADKVSQDANAAFYRTVRHTVTGNMANVPKLQYPASDCPIYYSKSTNGERVYFAMVNYNNEGLAIVKVAACSKNGERKVLNIIADA